MHYAASAQLVVIRVGCTKAQTAIYGYFQDNCVGTLYFSILPLHIGNLYAPSPLCAPDITCFQ